MPSVLHGHNGNLPRVPDSRCWSDGPITRLSPIDYWLFTRPADTQKPELVKLGKVCWLTGHDERALEAGSGPDHLEDYRFPGWLTSGHGSRRVR